MKPVGKKSAIVSKLALIFMSVALALTLAFGIAACASRDGDQYTISFETNCEATIAPRTYTVGQPFTLPTPYNYGYRFDGWHYDEALTQKVQANGNIAPSLEVDGDATLYAKWSVGQYSIIFDTKTGESFDDMTVSVGETVSLPQPQPQVLGGKSYPFLCWKYTAENKTYTDSFTLDYPEDVYLTALYDYGVLPSWEVDAQGRYHLATSTRAITTMAGTEMAYGEIEADITVEDYTCTGAGLVWNVTLGNGDAPFMNDGSEYWYFHFNPSAGAFQIAYIQAGSGTNGYSALKSVLLTQNTTPFKEKYTAAKDASEPLTIHVKIESSESGVVLYVDDALQLTVESSTGTFEEGNHFAYLGGLGVGFRSTKPGIYFEDLQVRSTHNQITLDANGGVCETKFVRVAEGVAMPAAELPVPANPGYAFEGWRYPDGEVYDGTSPLSSSITLKAAWSVIPHGATIVYEAGNETQIPYIYRANGEALGAQGLPAVQKLGFEFVGWFYDDGGTERQAEEETVFAAQDYDGDTKLVILTAKWQKPAGQEVTDVTLHTDKGSYTTDTAYEGYTAFKANSGSFATFENVHFTDGKYTVYLKYSTYGGNGVVFGATIRSDFGTLSDADFIQTGSSYYYWHMNHSTGVWQLAKVTSSANPQTANESNPGYDVLLQGTLADYIPGMRHELSVEFSDAPNGKVIILYFDGAKLDSYYDNGSIGGPALTGDMLGFRNKDGNCTYYGVHIQEAFALGGLTINLDANGGTLNSESTAEYRRPAGWGISLPAPTPEEGKTFVGWTTERDDGTTFFRGEIMQSEYDDMTLYAYYIDETQAVVTFDANGGTSAEIAVVTKGELQEDLPAATRTGYKFDGWYDGATKYAAGSTVSGDLRLTAHWAAVSDDLAGFGDRAVVGSFERENDGIYDIVTPYASSIIKLDKTFSEGRVEFYTTFTGATSASQSGFLFGATDLAHETSAAQTEHTSYYYWYVNSWQSSGVWGNWQLVKVIGTDYAGGVLNIAAGASWQNAYGEAFDPNGTYKMAVDIQRLSDGSAYILLYVNDRLFFSYLDETPLTGDELGIRTNQSAGTRKYFAFTTAGAEDIQNKKTLHLDLDGGAGAPTELELPENWKIELPMALTKPDNHFVGWSTAAGDFDHILTEEQLGNMYMNASYIDNTLYAIFTDQAIITYVTPVGTAPAKTQVSLNSQLTAEQLVAPTGAPYGYEFDGWYHEGTKVNVGDPVTESVTLTAHWNASLEGTFASGLSASKIGTPKTENDGVYDLFSVSATAIAKFDGISLHSGRLTFYTNFKGTGGKGGIVFGGTDLVNEVSADNSKNNTAHTSYYYWYFNQDGGKWQLAKCLGTAYTTFNNAVGVDWKYSRPYDANGNYKMTVELERLASGALRIALFVNDEPYFTTTDNSPLPGTEIGIRSTAGDYAREYYAVSAQEHDAIDNSEKLQITLHAGVEGTVNGQQDLDLYALDGWTITLPAALRDGYDFLGWSKASEDRAQIVENTLVIGKDIDGGAELYAIFTNEAVITYVTSVGTAPETKTLQKGEGHNFTSEELPELEYKKGYGYEFEGWYKDPETKVNAGDPVTESVTLTAHWKATLSGGTKLTSKRSLAEPVMKNDGVYDVYAPAANSFIIFNETLEEGRITWFNTFKGGSGQLINHFMFGGNEIDKLLEQSSTNVNDFSHPYYSWYINNTSGGWMLYKVTDGKRTNVNTQSAWNLTYGAAFDPAGTYKMAVELQKLGEKLHIMLYVNDKLFFDYVDEDPIGGAQMGILTAQATREWWGFTAETVEEIPEDDKYTVTFHGNGGKVDGAQENDLTVSLPKNWKYTLPAAAQDKHGFLGWATDSGADAATLHAGDEVVMKDGSVNANLYAVWSDQAIVSYESSVGTAPQQAQTPFDGNFTDELLPTLEYKTGFGYEFVGWEDESGELVTTSTPIKSVHLKARWHATVEEPITSFQASQGTAGHTNDGVYDLYKPTVPSMVRMDGEPFEEGKLSWYITFPGATAGNQGGVVFCATDLANETASQKETTSYYYWYINAQQGGWQLVKCVGTQSSSTGYQVLNNTAGTDWAKAAGSAWDSDGTYKMTIELKKEETSLHIILYVNDTQFFEYTDAAPLTGTEFGLRTHVTGREYYGFHKEAAE